MNILDTAIDLACKVHAGQVDKSGAPYILHPLRLMLSLQHEDERIVSVLHDAVEVGNVTLDDLRQLGLSEMVIEAISCLSKKPGEPYEHFISRLAVNELAKRVKIADIQDNLDVTRLHSMNDDELVRVKKHHKALGCLLDDSNR